MLFAAKGRPLCSNLGMARDMSDRMTLVSSEHAGVIIQMHTFKARCVLSEYILSKYLNLNEQMAIMRSELYPCLNEYIL